MSDPSLSDIDFKNKMTWVWATLKLSNRLSVTLGSRSYWPERNQILKYTV